MISRKNCIQCGIEFEKKRSHSLAYWETRKFCSHECYSISIKGKSSKRKGIKTNKPSWNSGKKGLQKAWNKGIKTGKPSWNKGLKGYMAGDKNCNWKGGITPINRAIRTSTEYKNWRKSVFERDNFECTTCHARNGNGVPVVLHADHIKPFALFPELRFDIGNGRTLFAECHRKTDTYGCKTLIKSLNSLS